MYRCLWQSILSLQVPARRLGDSERVAGELGRDALGSLGADRGSSPANFGEMKSSPNLVLLCATASIIIVVMTIILSIVMAMICCVGTS